MVVGWELVTEAPTLDDALAGVASDEGTLGEWLMSRLDERGVDRRSVIRRSRLNQTFAYQIFSDSRRPSRDKLIQLAFGLGLGIDETCELLERGGANPLRPACRRDVAIAFCLHRGLDVDSCDDMLWDIGEQTLVSIGR